MFELLHVDIWGPYEPSLFLVIDTFLLLLMIIIGLHGMFVVFIKDNVLNPFNKMVVLRGNINTF
ncbi:hypothetical protein CR513_26451, partial [Mucuna pruriens]